MLGHKSPENLLKHYDMCKDAPAQAKFAASIAQGAGSAQGIQFNPVEHETRCNVTNVMYINAKAVKDQKNKDTKKVNGEDEQPVESSSDDDIPLVELQRWKVCIFNFFYSILYLFGSFITGIYPISHGGGGSLGPRSTLTVQ